MGNQADEYNVLFHNRARPVFFTLCNDFRSNTALLDRMVDENVFQKLQARYVQELKRQLDEVAAEVLEHCTVENRNGCNRMLLSHIEAYTNEFVQKVRFL